MDRFEEIKKEFGDCDFLRAVLNAWTVDSIQWMINEIEALRAVNEAKRNSILNSFNRELKSIDSRQESPNPATQRTTFRSASSAIGSR